MSGRVRLAIDAMGGDNAPQMKIKGLKIARKRFPAVEYLLFGDQSKIEPLLKRAQKVARQVTIRHTVEAVSNEAKPSVALRAGRQSSMRLAIEAVRDGESQGMVSAGNTGALMAMAKMVLKTLPGIDRPAMATYFPTLRGESVMLDLGANLVCDARNLVQFAIMGEVFARTLLGLDRPTVGLLNVGSEDAKGHEELRSAAASLRAVPELLQFHGFVEGTDIGQGTVDVIVTDGFTGNIALKTAEGTAKLVNAFLRGAFRSSLLARCGYLFARGALRKVRTRTDPRRYNGAMFLGLNGIVVKSHGSTDALGFANAVGVAVDMITGRINDRIRAEFERLVIEPAKVRAAIG
jgi:glycerol-3-phosphate acyltransferase PlsX